VNIDIQEGIRSFVGRIVIYGQHRTRESVIRRQIALKDDTPLSVEKLLQSQQSLYRLGVFDLARVTPQNPDSTAAYQDIAVRLEESKRLIVRYGIGYQQREKVRGTLELSHLNIWGTGHRADLAFRGAPWSRGPCSPSSSPFPCLSLET